MDDCIIVMSMVVWDAEMRQLFSILNSSFHLDVATMTEWVLIRKLLRNLRRLFFGDESHFLINQQIRSNMRIHDPPTDLN